MNKLDVFKKEMGYIKNDRYRRSLEKLILELPDYFFVVPASSSGKHHSAYALGEGGLVRHTKAAVALAKTLLYENKVFGEGFNSDEKDLIIIALILHDGLKLGIEESKHTLFEHPLLMVDFIENKRNILDFNDSEIELLTSMIASHMGPWTSRQDSPYVLPLPITKYQKMVHICDYFVSRKFVNIIFENNDVID